MVKTNYNVPKGNVSTTLREEDRTPIRNIDFGTKSREQSPIDYKGSRLKGYELEDGRKMLPREMLEVYQLYENLLRGKRFEDARRVEDENKYPKTWLNGIIDALIFEEKNGLRGKLLEEFKDRGFSRKWFVHKQSI